jgi:hypothetical protein
MKTEAVESFFGWINERHAIYQRRLNGQPAPWTEDPILREYKFTNPFRENDRVTVWMRNNWTLPSLSNEELVFNCCLFRMIGTIEFAEQHGLVLENLGWDPEETKQLIENRLAKKLPTFTGAYIITNQGIKAPKSEVVVDYFLRPIWGNRKRLTNLISGDELYRPNALQNAHQELMKYKGFGGGGFMAYEVVTDLLHTKVLFQAGDRYLWANAGPGAKRGLNRIHDRPLKQSIKDFNCQEEMKKLLELASVFIGDHIKIEDVDMRCIEHSLCEWDKYERVRLDQGRPRSKFKPKQNLLKGPI